MRIGVVPFLVGCFALIGCGGPSAKISGRVTCQGKPIVGGILFSPKGANPDNTGAAVSTQTNEDGRFELRLTTIGKHTVVVSPNDVKLRVKKGQPAYPCDLSPKEWDVKAGDNEIVIELKKQVR